MSSRATMVRIRGGRVEYLEPGNTYDVVDSVIEGPDAVREYMDGGGRWRGSRVLGYRTSINSVEDEGCLLVDHDERVVIFFGGDVECSHWQQRAVMEGIASDPRWEGWDVRWAHKGLLDAARYLGQVPELLDGTLRGKVGNTKGLLIEGAVTSDPEEVASIIAVKSGGELDLYPLETMFPEDLLHYGGPTLASMLRGQGGYRRLRVGDYDLVRGFLLDEDSKTATFWGLCCEFVPECLEEAWPGWRAVDLEGDLVGFERILESHMSQAGTGR